MKHRVATRMLLAYGILAAQPADAYVQSVHQLMTRRAAPRVFSDLERHLGIRPTDSIAAMAPAKLLEQGAFDEDHLFPFPRPLNHFFDPVHGTGLTIRHPQTLSCLPVGMRADRWAISGAFNDYSVARAKSFYARSLLAPNPGSREFAQRELLLSLGHAVHLIQDMAQPEHTRNDLPGSAVGQASAASIWEEWGRRSLSDIDTAAVSFDNYPTVTLPDYESYFHTYDVGPEGRPAGRGLADYANRNFVTQDTNYHDNVLNLPCRLVPRCVGYEYPRIEEAARRTLLNQSEGIIELVPDASGALVPTPVIVTVDYDVYTSFPHDYYTGTGDSDIFHTFKSSFDLEAREFGCGPIYSLGDASYLSRAILLVPPRRRLFGRVHQTLFPRRRGRQVGARAGRRLSHDRHQQEQ